MRHLKSDSFGFDLAFDSQSSASMKFITMLLFVIRVQAIDPSTFRREIREHRARLQDIAREIYRRYGSEFPALSSLGQWRAESLILQYMALHDLPKLMSEQELKKMGWQKDITIFEELRQRYGICGRPSCVTDLNDMEAQLKDRVMTPKLRPFSQELQKNIWQELQSIEMTSDVLDTKIYRGSELGFTPRPKDASRFLKDIGRLRESEIAFELEPWVRTLSKVINSSCAKKVAN